MLNLNCVICAELFTPSDNVQVTTCGHLFHIACLAQWLERSKTCPQCRNKCNDRNIFRVYFNMANLNESRIDLGSLTEQLDNVNLQLKVKEKSCNKFEEDIKTLKLAQKKSMKTMLSMEQQMKKNDFVILNLHDQNRVLKAEADVAADLRKEVKSLKDKLVMMEGVSSLLTATNAEVESLLKTEKDPTKLCAWVATLKRELRQCENKKTDLRNMLKVVQTDLRKANELKRVKDERISQLESENYELTEKLKTKDIKSPTENNNSTIGLNSNLLANLMFEDRRLTISPATKEHVIRIENSNSPYLNIAASSVGHMNMFRRNPGPTTNFKNLSPIKKIDISNPNKELGALRKTKSDQIRETYSILKKPRLGLATGAVSAGMKPNFVFNGFGGSERVDPFANHSDEESIFEINHENETESERRAQKLKQRLKSGGLRNFNVKK